MNDKIEQKFSWVPIVKRGFLKSFSVDYDIGTLELLQENIAEEIQGIKCKFDLKKAKLLFECIEDFYYHFCRKWYQRKKFSPHMEVAWVHILSNFMKIGLLLSRGNKKSKWINRVLTSIVRFQGKKNLIYDALLSIHSLNKKYQCAYGAVLMHILIYIPAFVPIIIEDPAEYLKVFLLVRRLKFLIKDPAEKAELQMKTSRILAPPTLWTWLLAHDLNVTCMNSVRKINLGINICKKLRGKGSEREVVETLRKLLLPELSLERRATQQESCLGLNETILSAVKKEIVGSGLENIQMYITDSSKERNHVNMTYNNPLPEDAEKEVAIYETDIKMKMKKKRKCVGVACDDQPSSEDDDEITVNKIKSKKMQKSEKCVSMAHYDSTLSIDSDDQVEFEGDEKLTTNKTTKNNWMGKRNFVSASYYNPLPSKCGEEHVDIDKSEVKKTIGKIRDVVVSEKDAINSINHTLAINSFDNNKLIRDKKNKNENLQCETRQEGPYRECSSDKTKCLKIKKSQKQQNDFMYNSNSEAEPKRKKRKQREEMLNIAEKNSESIAEVSNDHSLLKNISRPSVIIKNRKKKQKRQKAKKMDNNSKEIEFITVNSESDTENSPSIIDEINVSDPIPKEKTCLSNCKKVDCDFCHSDDDQPVIVTEVKHYSNFGLSSSHEKKNKPIKTELKSNTETGVKIITDYFIDSNPSNNKSVQIVYDTIDNVEQKNASAGAKSENTIENEKDLNSLVNLAKLQDEISLVESNLRLEIADKSHTYEKTLNSYRRTVSPVRNEQQNRINESNITDRCFISEEKNNMPSDNQTNININAQDYKHEEETQNSCPDSSSALRKGKKRIISESNLTNEYAKDISTKNQADGSYQNCKNVDADSIISSNIEDHSGQIDETVEESSQDSAIQTRILDYFPNQASDFVENCIGCKNPKSGLTSGKLTDKSEEFVIQTKFQNEALPVLNSHPSHMPHHSSLNDDSCIQETDVPKVDFSEINLVNTEITKTDSKTFIKSELFKKDPLSFMVQKEKTTEENRFSHSSVDSPLSHISYLKTDGISSQNAAEAVILEKKISLQCIGDPLNTNISSQEIEINDEKLILDRSLPNKIDSKVIYSSDSSSSFEVDNPEVMKDNTNIDMETTSKVPSNEDLPKYQITGLFFNAKSPVLKTEAGLPENTERSINHQILDDPMKQNFNDETNSSEIKSPNSFTAIELMENMLKLVELASSVKNKIVRQNILKKNLTSTHNSSSVKLISSPVNEKFAKCLSFLDISADNESSEIPSYACLLPKSSEFLHYREFSHDQEDNRSEDTLSENKNIFKVDESEYLSEASNETESEESNFSPRDCNSPLSFDGVTEASSPKYNVDTYIVKTEFSFENTIERHRFYEEDNENHIRKPHGSETDLSIKNILPEGCMLNPVVNLGERCDSKNFIFANSSISADFHSTKVNSAILPDFRVGDEEIEEKTPSILCFESVQAVSGVNKSFNLINETSIKSEKIEDLPSDMHDSFTEKYVEINEVNNLEMAIKSGKKDATELCLTTDKKLSISDKDQKPIDIASKKGLSQGQGGIECDKSQEVMVCNKDKESVKLISGKKLSQDQETIGCDKDQELTETRKEREFLLSIKLRKRPVPLIQIQKSVATDKSYNASNQATPTTRCMTLRSRKPRASSNQDVGKSTSQTITKRSSKRLKADINLDFDFSELSLNSPKALRSKLNDSSNKSNSEVGKDNAESPTNGQENSCRRTRAPVISSNDIRIKEQDTDAEGYNLRSRKSVIMPGRLKL